MRFALLTLVALGACKDAKPESLPPPPPPVHDGITLIQPGAEPRQLLRYHLTKGDKATSELTYDLDVRADEPAGSAAAAATSDPTAANKPKAAAAAAKPATTVDDAVSGPAPTLIVRLDTTVDDVLADGSAKLRIAIVDARVRDRKGATTASDVVRQQAAAAVGVVISETLAPDGTVSEPHLEAGLDGKPRAREQLGGLVASLAHIAMQLPGEPVGAGAVWRERKPLREGGIAGLSETTYTLKAITGTAISYAGTGRLTGESQTIEQDGTKVAVTSPRGHAETSGTIDLAHYAPDVTSTSSFTAGMAVDAPAGTPGAAASNIQLSLALQVSPAPAATPAPADPATASASAVAPAASR